MLWKVVHYVLMFVKRKLLVAPCKDLVLEASNTCACLYCAVRNLEDVYVLLFMYFGRVHPEGNPKMGGYCNAS